MKTGPGVAAAVARTKANYNRPKGHIKRWEI